MLLDTLLYVIGTLLYVIGTLLYVIGYIVVCYWILCCMLLDTLLNIILYVVGYLYDILSLKSNDVFAYYDLLNTLYRFLLL